MIEWTLVGLSRAISTNIRFCTLPVAVAPFALYQPDLVRVRVGGEIRGYLVVLKGSKASKKRTLAFARPVMVTSTSPAWAVAASLTIFINAALSSMESGRFLFTKVI